ncbi:TetR family transcriptional regulator [Roseibium hamelinense]|uniref:TetR family transcriptional regulator n=1 Tax=Roseibium hamelinense TaxID=150831 RepID=A0A562SNR1_9HYPH|nr:TetR/AcrR family transcriptional regulator [Roseibium hamelinense]MTI45066.1 TetR/AcrR family transcriptional regulator [Roseibium hamelinense]TWI82330.1 TetR family transcriptional regulator [Roseibium hamelinense]
MDAKKNVIAAGLETVFRTRGFAEPSVPDLKDGAGVSLRTLYKYFPSREEMIVGALDYRQQRYLTHLAERMPPPGIQAAFHVIKRLGIWMDTNSSNGCLFFHALSAHPDSKSISNTVLRHKAEIVDFLSQACGCPRCGQQLYVIHEGITAAWSAQGDKALTSASPLVLGIFKETAND